MQCCVFMSSVHIFSNGSMRLVRGNVEKINKLRCRHLQVYNFNDPKHALHSVIKKLFAGQIPNCKIKKIWHLVDYYFLSKNIIINMNIIFIIFKWYGLWLNTVIDNEPLNVWLNRKMNILYLLNKMRNVFHHFLSRKNCSPSHHQAENMNYYTYGLNSIVNYGQGW